MTQPALNSLLPSLPPSLGARALAVPRPCPVAGGLRRDGNLPTATAPHVATLLLAVTVTPINELETVQLQIINEDIAILYIHRGMNERKAPVSLELNSVLINI